ncbi:auxin-responsive protein SAUR32-like [Silene latifolia]|uniref:auxin-responsive protein SAUR32-like n=1 Tax=Silene latifolia TaxID=37657 RepID=UPI003D76C794
MAGRKSLLKFKRCIVKLRRCMQLLQPIRPVLSDDDEIDTRLMGEGLVPKGHFAVLAGNGEEDQKRFVVDLRYLRSPGIVKLLKEAEEEYGFQQEGALVVPCRPEELRKILGNTSSIYN